MAADSHIATIDAARGAAAFYVLFSHLEGAFALRQTFPVASVPLALLADYAHQAVIAFFLLSGFSIHYSSAARRLDTASGLNRYYFLRVRRIVPIFLVAVALTLLLGFLGCRLGSDRACGDIADLSPAYLAGNLLFLSDRKYIAGIILPSMAGNTPLWSLSYEVVFYVVYPAFWFIVARYGITIATAAGALASALALLSAALLHPTHAANVMGLYVLWCLGAWVADQRLRGDRLGWPAHAHFLACYVAAQSVWVLEYAGLGMLYDWLWGLLFFGLMSGFVLAPIPRDRQHTTWLALAIVAGLALIVLVSRRVELARDMPVFYMKTAATALAFVVLAAAGGTPSLRQFIRRALAPCLGLGAISYAIYVVHYPVIRFATGVAPVTFGWRLAGPIVLVAVTLLLAFVLEKRFQPLANAWLARIWRTGSESALERARP